MYAPRQPEPQQDRDRIEQYMEFNGTSMGDQVIDDLLVGPVNPVDLHIKIVIDYVAPLRQSTP